MRRREMTNKADSKIRNMSTGGHLGGTNLGQGKDAKTTSTVEKGGDKARPNEGREQPLDFIDKSSD
ncbi:hypothetical protein PZ895_14055 [Mesorhizobium sp. YIM 152430]|uniref:hypothetical protein n=1 Tax=Mesorhizobium sp. YIM 152430 TaxID=3031761 RepID=UPI0023DCC876|nr:hypothetical protein [Mesorhizobium sp. YIM 152430]MDF1600887.1 hypothetical protein [Mesorhizobium sp. YIM 152430]